MELYFNRQGCLLLVTVATAVFAVSGLLCQFPHCETVKCDPVVNCTGTVRKGGGYCGCCLACFTYIGYGEPCEIKDSVQEILYPPTAHCNIDLYCDRNTSTCQPYPWIG